MSSNGTVCPFCVIDAEKTRVIEARQHVIVVLSNPRLMPGHILVIPKRHVERLTGLHPDEKAELWSTVEEFQQRIVDRLASGCDIRQNYRPFQPQDRLKIHHLHIHLQPREMEDELYKQCQIYEKRVFQPLSEHEVKHVVDAVSDSRFDRSKPDKTIPPRC